MYVGIDLYVVGCFVVEILDFKVLKKVKKSPRCFCSLLKTYDFTIVWKWWCHLRDTTSMTRKSLAKDY